MDITFTVMFSGFRVVNFLLTSIGVKQGVRSCFQFWMFQFSTPENSLELETHHGNQGWCLICANETAGVNFLNNDFAIANHWTFDYKWFVHSHRKLRKKYFVSTSLKIFARKRCKKTWYMPQCSIEKLTPVGLGSAGRSSSWQLVIVEQYKKWLILEKWMLRFNKLYSPLPRWISPVKCKIAFVN
jgi:hypothetical protein